MKKITSTFLKGLFTLLPIVVSIYVVVWMLQIVEVFARGTLLVFWPDFLYLPGMGLLVVCLVVFAFGTIVDQPLAKWLVRLFESVLSQVPFLKSVYLAIKDFTGFLSHKTKKDGSTVVSVQFPNTNVQIIGLVTRRDLTHLAEGVRSKDNVAVYFPMSYQIGGYTLMVPKDWLKPVNMGVEETMRHILTAWLPGGAERIEASETPKE